MIEILNYNFQTVRITIENPDDLRALVETLKCGVESQRAFIGRGGGGFVKLCCDTLESHMEEYELTKKNWESEAKGKQVNQPNQ